MGTIAISTTGRVSTRGDDQALAQRVELGVGRLDALAVFVDGLAPGRGREGRGVPGRLDHGNGILDRRALGEDDAGDLGGVVDLGDDARASC